MTPDEAADKRAPIAKMAGGGSGSAFGPQPGGLPPRIPTRRPSSGSYKSGGKTYIGKGTSNRTLQNTGKGRSEQLRNPKAPSEQSKTRYV